MLLPMFCFSQGKYGDLELFTGMPFFYGSLRNDYKGDPIWAEIPFSMGIGATNYNVFTDRNMGIVFAASFIFPKSLVYTTKGQTSRYGLKDEITVLDFQFGLGYHLLGREAGFRLPVTFGLHFLYLSGVLESSPTETQELNSFSLGFGGSMAAEMHINPTVYFFARLQVFFDFITLADYKTYTGVNVGGRMAYFIDGRDYDVLSYYIGIAPIVGVGMKIDGFIGNDKK